MIKPTYLRCEYLLNPLGIDVIKPRLSWILVSDERAQEQTAYHILVASSQDLLYKEEGDLWDTSKIKSNESTHVEYEGHPLKSQMFCFWKVRVWDKNDHPSDWSEPAFWSMGLLTPADWKAKWIGSKSKNWWVRRKFPKEFGPLPFLRKSFTVAKKIKRAILYATALGEYVIYINGEHVGDRYLAPEWTDYDYRVQYQTYDVTSLLQDGENVIGAILADGWYAGTIGLTFLLNHSVYGMNSRLRLQLSIEKRDGSVDEILSDEDWKLLENGPIEAASHFKGETYNTQKEEEGWAKPGFNDSNWKRVTVDNSIDKLLVAQMNEPIRVVKELKPIEITEPKPGIFIFNLGQNIAGWCKIKLTPQICDPETTITLKHAEMLKENGLLYRRNLKSAKATDKYIITIPTEREFHPHFTYHGFQYVGVSGLKANVEPTVNMLTGCAIASDTPLTGSFESSDPLLNQLWSNILWTQRDNLISVPTDCPQRDERLGWMGDAQVFCQTSIFNMDMAAFYTKWIRDIRDAQFENGSYSDIVPNTRKNKLIGRMGGAPAWADCGIIVPWVTYLNYGDRRLIEDHYESAKRYIDYLHLKNPNLIWRKGNFLIQYNDWLNGNTIKSEDYPKRGAEIPKDVFATCYFAHSTEIVAKMAKVLNREKEFIHYSELSKNIKAAFAEKFIDENGRIKGDNQSCYALALDFDMLSKENRPLAIKYMLEAIDRYDGRISTGFCTTLPMMMELTKSGHNEVAYQLLQSRRFPSWYYMIDQGATTMWERWDGYVKGRGFQSWIMNSFNHYSIGAVGEWIYKVILGIDLDEAHPGFKHFVIKPQPGGTLTWAKGHYNSIHGKIGVSWKLENDKYTLEVTIPVNTSATIEILARDPKDITEGGNPITESEELKFIDFENNTARYALGSGFYKFQSKIS